MKNLAAEDFELAISLQDDDYLASASSHFDSFKCTFVNEITISRSNMSGVLRARALVENLFFAGGFRKYFLDYSCWFGTNSKIS